MHFFSIFFKRACEGSDWKSEFFPAERRPEKLTFSDRQIPEQALLSGRGRFSSDPTSTMAIV